ncbi:tRNA 2-selenouridine(34) synthase MnmH [Gorillibacterium timonense]|uniref:tRNA 2-selenouridine(34) synthase MnmH n=1 Tax=Gorillibacterium timonense TaxID=1689269 RepID=UPI00071E201C|nr:tRNA 2-selenouridine(34) synthase MnmH [Gorillibacterium timonense]
MFQDLSIEKIKERQATKPVALIDVRSPSEFRDATIPGSRNIPFFTDDERAEVGTLYVQVGVHAAKERGLEIASAKLPQFVKEFAAIPGDKAVFCWRGGMRSKTVATVLSLMDIHVYRLSGGYRAYRQWVLDKLEAFDFQPKPYVIHGLTGTGKTNLLRRLKAKGYPVLDLEGMAGHRGSVFGQIGLQANNQKTFDALLAEELLGHQHRRYLLFEAESKRIGKVVMPPFLAEQKDQATQLWIEMPLEARVRQILADYRPEEHKEAYLEAFRFIKGRIHIPVAAEIEQCLGNDEFGEAVSLLLEHYYDPRYEHSSPIRENVEKIIFDVRNADEAEAAILAYLASRDGSS